MRTVINILLLLLVALFSYLLINSIREPIMFKAEKDRRQNAVTDKLRDIRKTMEFFRDANDEGAYAPTWDSLKYVLQNGNFRNIKVVGDPDDPDFEGEITYDTTYTPILDQVKALNINVDSIEYIPFGGGAKFDLIADTLTYQSTKVNVVQVSTIKEKYMGPFADIKYTKYDNSYDPKSIIKFGDLSKPSLAGNWE